VPHTKTLPQQAKKLATKLGAFLDHHHTDLTAAELLALGAAVDILVKREQQ
jgi:hypothetical protein